MISFGSVPASAAAISPRFSRSAGSIQASPSASIEVFLRLARDLLAAVDLEQAVFVQREPEIQRPLPQRDVVGLRSGEILHRRAARLGRDQPQIRLIPLPQQHARLRLALTQDAVHQLVRHERRHHIVAPVVDAADEDVEVAAGLAAAAQAADDVDGRAGRALAQVCGQRVGDRRGIGQQVTPRMRLLLGDGLQDELFLLRAHPLDRPQRPGRGRRFELVERGDALRFVQQRDRLRADTLKAEQVEDRRRELLEQLLVIGGRAGRADLEDLRGEVLADARNRAELGVGHGRERFGGLGGDLRGGAICPDLERVLRFQFEQVGDLAEQACDSEVFHEDNGARRDERGASGDYNRD